MEELDSVQKFIEIQGWPLLTFFICLHNRLSSSRQYKWMVASFRNFYGKTWVGFCLNILLKTGARDFQNSHPFERSARFYVTMSASFKCFQYFNFAANFLENENIFEKTGVPFFSLKTHHFHSKLLCQKPVLRQIEW